MLNKKVIAQKSKTEKMFFFFKQNKISEKKVTEIAENGCPVQLP